MFKRRKTRLLLACILISIFMVMIFSPSIVDGQVDSLLETQKKLMEVSEEEREILEHLFFLVQEIEEMEREEGVIASDIKIINDEIHGIEEIIASETIAYEKKQENLKEVLKSYQRRGAGSYIKIILESDSLAMLLRRINTLRDLTRNTGQLLEQLEESQERLSVEKANLSKKLGMMEEKQQQLKISLAKNLELKEDMEKYLTSLEEEREYYQEHLHNIRIMWDELKIIFSGAAKEFSRIIEEGNLPEDALKTTFTIFGIKGSIDEETFNNIIREHASLPEMVFRFYPDQLEVKLPEKNLILSGTFIILDGHTLKFEVKEGSFYGMSLETSAIEELFREGYMLLNLKPLVESNRIDSLKILEGYIELLIKPVLF